MTPFLDGTGKPIPPMPAGTARPDSRPFFTGTSYFFKKSNGRFIAVDAKNAWEIYSGKMQTIGRQPEPWEYVGRTDGSALVKKANELREKFYTMTVKEFQLGLEKALKAEFLKAKKDKTPPPNFDSIGQNGMPINLSSYGN